MDGKIALTQAGTSATLAVIILERISISGRGYCAVTAFAPPHPAFGHLLPHGQRCEAFWAAFWQKYLSCVALALPVSYPVMGWQTTGKASATRTKSRPPWGRRDCFRGTHGRCCNAWLRRESGRDGYWLPADRYFSVAAAMPAP
jgi:hypothetical protein